MNSDRFVFNSFSSGQEQQFMSAVSDPWAWDGTLAYSVFFCLFLKEEAAAGLSVRARVSGTQLLWD